MWEKEFDDIYKTHLLIEGIFFEGLTILNNTLTHVVLCLHLTHILYKVEQFLSAPEILLTQMSIISLTNIRLVKYGSKFRVFVNLNLIKCIHIIY